MSNPIKKTLICVVALGALALGLGGAAIVQAGGDEGERSVTGAQAEKAKSAALKITKGATANSVERDGEDGATWEVEVTKRDGATVDVRLDERYGLVVVESDTESSDDSR